MQQFFYIENNTSFQSYLQKQKFYPIHINLKNLALRMIEDDDVFGEVVILDDAEKTAKKIYVQDSTPNFTKVSKHDKQHINKMRYNLMYLRNTTINKERALEDFIQLAKMTEEVDDPQRQIPNFRTSYQMSSIITVYTSQSFLYPVLNKGLRMLKKPTELAYLRLPFSTLFHEIRNLYVKQKQDKFRQGDFKCFRACRLSEEEENYFSQVGEYLEMEGFLSTSINYNKAINHLSNNSWYNTIFEIRVKKSKEGYGLLDSGYAQISGESLYPDQEQVLFNPINIFKVISSQKKLEQVTNEEINVIVLEYGIMRDLMQGQKELEDVQKELLVNLQYQISQVYNVKNQDDALMHCQENRKLLLWCEKKLKIMGLEEVDEFLQNKKFLKKSIKYLQELLKTLYRYYLQKDKFKLLDQKDLKSYQNLIQMSLLQKKEQSNFFQRILLVYCSILLNMGQNEKAKITIQRIKRSMHEKTDSNIKKSLRLYQLMINKELQKIDKKSESEVEFIRQRQGNTFHYLFYKTEHIMQQLRKIKLMEQKQQKQRQKERVSKEITLLYRQEYGQQQEQRLKKSLLLQFLLKILTNKKQIQFNDREVFRLLLSHHKIAQILKSIKNTYMALNLFKESIFFGRYNKAMQVIKCLDQSYEEGKKISDIIFIDTMLQLIKLKPQELNVKLCVQVILKYSSPNPKDLNSLKQVQSVLKARQEINQVYKQARLCCRMQNNQKAIELMKKGVELAQTNNFSKLLYQFKFMSCMLYFLSLKREEFMDIVNSYFYPLFVKNQIVWDQKIIYNAFQITNFTLAYRQIILAFQLMEALGNQAVQFERSCLDQIFLNEGIKDVVGIVSILKGLRYRLSYKKMIILTTLFDKVNAIDYLEKAKDYEHSAIVKTVKYLIYLQEAGRAESQKNL